MEPESQPAPEPPSPRRRRNWPRIIRRVLFLALLAGCGYFTWREYDFRQAIKQAQALGWVWYYDDPIDAVKKDWRAAFRKATWFEGTRGLFIPADGELDRHASLLRRLAPRGLTVSRFAAPTPGVAGPPLEVDKGGTGMTNLEALRGLTSLQYIRFMGCNGLTNLDALGSLTSLQEIGFSGCTSFTNVDAFRNLPALRELTFFGSKKLTNLDGLRGHQSLQILKLAVCAGPANLDALKGLPALQEIELVSCSRLTNVDALRDLPALRKLEIRACQSLPAEAVPALKAALPNVGITDGLQIDIPIPVRRQPPASR